MLMVNSHHCKLKVNLASTNEHVPEIEQRIRAAKERTRAARHSLPQQDPNTNDDPHCAALRQTIEPVPNEGRNLGHCQSEDCHDR